MEESILRTIKHLIGDQMCEDYFDMDFVIHINSALNRLNTLGVGGEKPFRIHGYDETWFDLLGDDECRYENVKDYIHLKVKQVFDPPTSPTVSQSLDNSVKELEWMIADRCDIGN